MKRHLSIEIYGADDSDLETALQEVTRLTQQGFTSGHDKNDTGGFAFAITDELEEEN